MRRAFVKTLVRLAEQDARIFLLTGDLGYSVLEPFSGRFPDRFLNAGVAEQNTMGVATGLAEAGFIPFVYSITTFAVLRTYEFIRNGPVHHRLPVRIVGVGSGVEYGHDGISHYALEDVGLMRLQPGMTVIAPADNEQASEALSRTWDLPGPVYYRISKGGHTSVPGLNGRFELGRAQVICEGSDLAIIALGSIAGEAVAAAQILASRQLSCAVVVISAVHPPPVADLIATLGRFRLALTVEAHRVIGGIGSLVSEVIAEQRLPCRLVRCGITAPCDGRSGSDGYLRRGSGVDASSLADTALRIWREDGL
jgi:transketolase